VLTLQQLDERLTAASEVRGKRQRMAIAQIDKARQRGIYRIMVQGATGWGKTAYLAAYLVLREVLKGNRVLFVVPRRLLVDETVEAFEKLLQLQPEQIGVIQANHPRTNEHAPIQVATIQTLTRREGGPQFSIDDPQFDLVIIDEAHTWYPTFYPRWFQDPQWEKIPIIGLSATPWTSGLGRFYEELIPAATAKQGIDEKWLCDYDHYAPSNPDFSMVRRNPRSRWGRNEYREGDVVKVMSDPAILADVLDAWWQRGQGLATVCFAVNRAHGKQLTRQFREAGIRAEYMDGDTPSLEREQIKKDFHSGEVEIVVNVEVLVMGIDWNIECIILAMGTESPMRYVQMIGRGLRTAPGNKHKKLVINDHGANQQRLGLVQEIHYKTLDQGWPPAEQAPHQMIGHRCPCCSFVFPVSATEAETNIFVCPKCGFEDKPMVITIDDTLVRVGRLTLAQERRQFYLDLVCIQHRNGFHFGFVGSKFRERYGVYPTSDQMASWNRLPSVSVPSADTLRWLARRARDLLNERRKKASKDERQQATTPRAKRDKKPAPLRLVKK
jgi:DNA repair protein RadD